MDWHSSVIVTEIARRIVEEVLGYHTTADAEPALRTRYAFLAMAGCKTYNNAVEPGCSMEPSNLRLHVAFDSWLGTNVDSWNEVQSLYATRAPEDLGTMGYSGREHMFVKKQLAMEAYEADGVMLDFYKGYNASHHKAHMYFDSIFEIDWSVLKPCHFPQSIFQSPAVMATYLRVTGDRDGLLEVSDGEFIAKCQHTHWWVSPSCRHNTSECIPVLTYATGFAGDTFMQWAAFHDIPLAIAVAKDWDLYVKLVRESKALFYWWIPDVTFLDLAPQPVIFPEHSAKEWDDGLMRTSAAGGYVNKVASYDLRYRSERVFKFIGNFQLDMQEIDQLLLDTTHRVPARPVEEAACDWIRSYESRWRRWVPLATNCAPGFGLTNDRGVHVSTRAEATRCTLCQRGEESMLLSDSDGTTHRCSQCPSGKFQNEAGKQSCTNCAPGSVSRTPGALECELCALGKYANDSGLTTCSVCDPENSELTTSHIVDIDGRKSWLQFQGASSRESCKCPPESFLHEGRCQRCQRGSYCPGSGEITLLRGFYSSIEDPGSVFECFESPGRCPGGIPGTCAEGRDTESLACSLCLPGQWEHMGECIPCQSSDYVFIVVVVVIMTSSISGLHLVVLATSSQGRSHHKSLVLAGLAVSMIVFFVQVLNTIRLFDIAWGEPFLSLLHLMRVASLDRLMRSLNVLSCISRVDPLTAYISAVLVVPFFLLLVPLLTHLLYLICCRPGNLKLNQLWSTCGMLYVLLYIALCTNLVGPFRCHTHPNGMATLKTFDGVLCTLEDEHWLMSVVGGFGLLFPIGFLALCCWVIFFEYPKRVARLDVKFMRATAFLTFRFRPGKEYFAVLFSVRETLIVLSPLLSAASSSIVCLTMLLYANLVLIAREKPWRLPQANILNMMVLTSVLAILDMGSFFADVTDSRTMMLASALITGALVSAMVGLAVLGVVRHFGASFRKDYRFFLCHHKMAAGSLARLLKIEFLKRGPAFTTFVDTDDLTDLADLFGMVSQQVQTLVVLASSEILRRKWCVGEMVTAFVHKVETVMVLLPGFEKPTSVFVDNYLFVVPDIKDLSGYSISIADVQATLQWLGTLEVLELTSLASPEAIDDLTTRLTKTQGGRKSSFATESTECVILADPDNMEAMATAYVLFALLSPRMIKDRAMTPPGLLIKGSSMPDNVLSLLLICSQDCLESECVAKWLLQTSRVDACAVLPIIAEDSFQFPTNSGMARLLGNANLQHLDLQIYVQLIRCIFEEVAIYFSARASSATELGLRLDQLEMRLRTSRPKPLSSRLSLKATEDETPDGRGRGLHLRRADDGNDFGAHCLHDAFKFKGRRQGDDEDTDGNFPSDGQGSASSDALALDQGPLVEELI